MKLNGSNVEKVIAERIDPILSIDGGTAEVVEVDAEKGVVRLKLGGSYRGCPSRHIVFDSVVSPTLKKVLSGVHNVEMVSSQL